MECRDLRSEKGSKLFASLQKKTNEQQSHSNVTWQPYWRVSNLLGEALLSLDLVVLLRRHPGDAGRRGRRPWQRLHLLDGFHGDALGKHPEEGRHVHDDALLVRVRHRHICGGEKCIMDAEEAAGQRSTASIFICLVLSTCCWPLFTLLFISQSVRVCQSARQP